jgi:signal transduction histidine kinase
MNSRARSPIARRLRLALFAVGALCIAVAVTAFYTLWTRQTLALRTTELERQVGVVGAGVAVGSVLPGGPRDTGQVRARFLKVEAGLIGARLSVTDASGTVLFGTAGGTGAASYPIAGLERADSEFGARVGVLDVVGAGRVVVVAVPVAFAAPDEPERYLVGAKPVADIQSSERWVLVSIGLSAVVALLVAWLVGTWLASRVTGPLVRLTDGARAVAAGEWGRQVPVEGDDEVSSLARAFNDMSARVASAYLAQQAFVGDVSHELRTPVTSIRGFAQAIGDGVVSDEAGIRRAAGIIVDEADRLTDLTAALLSLADLDSGSIELVAVPVDITTLARTLCDRFGTRAHEAGLEFSVDLGSERPLADPERLLQAVSGIVENALAHAAGAGRIRLVAGVSNTLWRLEVCDDGPGILPEDRERIFGRFARLDPSRASASGGAGLGLAICRRVVELMGGRVWADSSPDLGGARFTVELPAARADMLNTNSTSLQ